MKLVTVNGCPENSRFMPLINVYGYVVGHSQCAQSFVFLTARTEDTE